MMQSNLPEKCRCDYQITAGIDTCDRGFQINGLLVLEMRLHKLAERLSEKIISKLNEHLEMYAAAFLKETDLKPSDCVLEVTPTGGGYRYEFKKKD